MTEWRTDIDVEEGDRLAAALAAVPHPYQAKPAGMTLPYGCHWCGDDRDAPQHRGSAAVS